MKSITYQIEFFDYWHAGSGLTGSTYADSLVNKNDSGLPIIPGKTIKGLLREAAEEINRLNKDLISEEFINTVFGVRAEKGNSSMDKEGKSFFTNAGLSKHLSEALADDASLKKELFKVISSTEIDENGQAKEGSLRQMEVTIPLTLYGRIENFPEGEEKKLETCFNWVKRLGQNRNRGLGRCQFSILK